MTDRPVIVWCPATRFGKARVDHTRVAVKDIGERVRHGYTMEEMTDNLAVSPPQVLVACWWLGRHGPWLWRLRWGRWARSVEDALWNSRYDAPLPRRAFRWRR